jgi:RNA polymerase sigma factor (sigma-70 family)
MISESNRFTDEAVLIENCLKGDRRSQQELYNLFSPKMYAVCMRYSGNAEDARDLLQDGFVKVYSNLHRYRGDGSFEGWIRRIFINTSIEHFRKKIYLNPITESHENSVEDREITALDKIATKDVLNMVQKLSPGYRTVFNLYVVEGYNHKEIGELLGISEGTSKSQLARAKSTLQDFVNKAAKQKQ